MCAGVCMRVCVGRCYTSCPVLSRRAINISWMLECDGSSMVIMQGAYAARQSNSQRLFVVSGIARGSGIWTLPHKASIQSRTSCGDRTPRKERLLFLLMSAV